MHLTYCLNVHPGETWAENLAAIREKTLSVRDSVGVGAPFGLGLRLSAQAAEELSDAATREGFREFLAEEDLYVFTINGFPYGRFHGERVKENVYRPDWRSDERREYTIRLADLLAELLPDGVCGSISTVPGSFKPWIRSDGDVNAMVANLVKIAVHLFEIREATGKEIHLGLEPEPSCYLETTLETIDFFERQVFDVGSRILSNAMKIPRESAEAILRRHLGVCFDTCHAAVQFENLADSVGRYREAGIRISKCQISAALAAPVSSEAIDALRVFVEPVYLHQTRVRFEDGTIRGWDDLPPALEVLGHAGEAGEARVHFHVPLFLEAYGVLRSTFGELTPKFIEAAKMSNCQHFEVETYTFDVLPGELRTLEVVDFVKREFGSARKLLGI